MVRKFTRSVVRHFIPSWQSVRDPVVRNRYGALEGGVSIVVNVILFVLKIVWGIISGSVALIADGIHTLSDVLTSIVIIVSFRIAKKPSDAIHPFGHGRMEAIASVIVAVLLMMAGVEILESSINRVLHPQPVHVSWVLFIVVILTIVLKDLLARFSDHLGKMIESQALEADSWHHRTDAISSIFVLATLITQKWGWSFLDGIAGTAVAVLIMFTGLKIVRKGVDDLLGSRPPEHLIDAVKRRVREVPGVLGVHDLIIHQYGQKRVISYHLVVSEELSLKQGHELAEKVGLAVDEMFHTHSTVHLDPIDPSDPEVERLNAAITEIFGKNGILFHDLHVRKERSEGVVSFDMVSPSGMKDEETERLRLEVTQVLCDRFRWIKEVRIRLEPKYTL